MLRDMAGAGRGMYKILEPKTSLRAAPRSRGACPGTRDLIMVPGVAFDAPAYDGARFFAITTACCSTPARRAPWWPCHLSASFSRYPHRGHTTSSWTKSSRSKPLYPGRGRQR